MVPPGRRDNEPQRWLNLLPQRLRNVPHKRKKKHGQPKTGHDKEI
jgi:hypothetical protein